MAEPTYIFKDDHVYTMVDGQVVASVKQSDFEGGEGGVEMPERPEELQGENCPGCGMPTEPQDNFCPGCGTALTEGGGPEYPDEGAYLDELAGNGPEVGLNDNSEVVPRGQMIAQTIETPNGMKGKVLARVPSLWGEEVTVRFDNGTIRKMPVDERLTFSAAEETSTDPVASLEERLAASYSTTRPALIERGNELMSIQKEAASSVADATDAEAVELSKIVTQAKYELAEVTAALEAINQGDIEAFEPPAPISSMPTVSQVSTNGGDGSWLDGVHSDMIREGNEQDYKKLMDEGPEAFVASLTPTQLADQGVTRIMAQREIEAKTVGADDQQKDAYTRMWLARVEQQRKAAFAGYKQAAAEEAKTASKEASTESSPDESLFF